MDQASWAARAMHRDGRRVRPGPSVSLRKSNHDQWSILVAGASSLISPQVGPGWALGSMDLPFKSLLCQGCPAQ